MKNPFRKAAEEIKKIEEEIFSKKGMNKLRETLGRLQSGEEQVKCKYCKKEFFEDELCEKCQMCPSCCSFTGKCCDDIYSD